MAFDNKTSLFQRLVTYKSLSQSNCMLYCTRLAECGYIYTEQDKELECVYCKMRVPICDTWPDIETKLKHRRDCCFEDVLKTVISKNDELELASMEIISDVEATAAGSLRGAEGLSVDSHITMVGLNDDSSEIRTMGAVGGYPVFTSEFQVPDVQRSSFLPCISSEYYKAENDQLSQERNKHQTGLSFSTSKISDYSNMFTEYIEFPQLFIPEYLRLNSRKDLKPSSYNKRNCDKNPGHFAYFNTINLKLEQIPKQFRCSEMLNVLKWMSYLTVRIVVYTTSSQRRNANQHKVRVGSGFVIEHLGQVKTSLENQRKTSSEKSKFKSLQKLMSFGKKKPFGLVFIQTSRHLVYNDEEAQNTTVEFFYDTQDSKDIVSLEGKYLLTNTTSGDSQCLLVCECSDTGFIQRVNQLQQEFFEVANSLPIKAKKGMSKKLFMVHHPHGGPKVLSYGDYVTVKYKMNISESAPSDVTLTKLTAIEPVGPDVSEYRKTLFYAADTCPGSFGAPILTFCPRQPGANGDVTFKLDIWMHNGVETSHKLGTAVLKECLVEDFQKPRPDDQKFHPEEDSDDDEDNLGKQKVNSPVYKVTSTPSHPEYISYQSRLESFKDWTFGHIMKDEYLSTAGFYYTGVSDCVRCFQCGLGLRTWKQGDDIITEHEKYRPTCPYLKSLPKGQEDNITGAMKSLEAARNGVCENLTLKLLESEHRSLKKQLTCKVCFKSDIKDVFLPCGELYACSECSKLLTQCPSCGKQILATVTVYLT